MNSIKGTALAVVAVTVIGVAGAALVSYTWNNTSEQIAINERNYSLRALNQILPADEYDNALFEDTTTVSDKDLLGSDESLLVYRARRDGQPVAAILQVVAPEGYSGAIHLLVGIYFDGTVAGVRVAAHNETPGLGDKIEIEHTDWITTFEGKSLENPAPPEWDVKKHGGEFDSLTGATITPRAVVTAVRNALIYFSLNRETIFAQETP